MYLNHFEGGENYLSNYQEENFISSAENVNRRELRKTRFSLFINRGNSRGDRWPPCGALEDAFVRIDIIPCIFDPLLSIYNEWRVPG